jgi:ferredoxin
MSLFTVDQKECRRDGLCVAECPAKLIEIIGKEGFPTPIAGTADRSTPSFSTEDREMIMETLTSLKNTLDETLDRAAQDSQMLA